MIDIDKRTLFLDFTITNIVGIIFIFMLWYQHKNRYQGLSFILVSYLLNLISTPLIYLRNIIGDFYSIVLSNELTMIGMFCILLGLEKFIGLRSRHYLSYIYLLTFVLIQSYFTWIIPNMAARNVNISFGHIFFCVNLVYLLFYRTPKSLRNITQEAGIFFLLFIVVNCIRFYDQLHIAPIYALDKPEQMKFDLFILLLYQIFILAFSFVIIHIINKRLEQDILKDEEEIRLSRNILKNMIVNLQSEYENEKINLATQIDNNLNQSLAALLINLGIIKKKLTNSDQQISTEIIQLVEQTYNHTGITIERSLGLMNEIRNEILYLFGIVEAIKFSIEEIQKQKGITCTFQSSPENIELEKKQSFALYNIYQDIIGIILNGNQTNKLYTELESDGLALKLKITANGKCFEIDSNPVDEASQFAILKEKVALINGLLDVRHLNNDETIITIEIENLILTAD